MKNSFSFIVCGLIFIFDKSCLYGMKGGYLKNTVFIGHLQIFGFGVYKLIFCSDILSNVSLKFSLNKSVKYFILSFGHL